MTLEFRIKQAALNRALDSILRNVKRSPKRSARNLLELLYTVEPNKARQLERSATYKILLFHCQNSQTQDIKDSFFEIILK